jgi:hypothetical protein
VALAAWVIGDGFAGDGLVVFAGDPGSFFMATSLVMDGIVVDRKGHILNLSYASYQEIRGAKRKNRVCAIVTGLFMAKVERVIRRMDDHPRWQE